MSIYKRNDYKKRLRKKRKRRKKGFILIITFFIALVTLFGGKLISKQEKEEINVGNSGLEKQEKEEINVGNSDLEKKEEVKIPDNSGYLTLKDDPNADDAKIVSENTKGIITGTKSYPVRNDGKKVVYLTFDDGPSTTNTPKVLDILDEYNVKATFFVLGKSLDKNEEAREILKEEVKRGHAIGNHTYSHDYSQLYPNRTINVDKVLEEINKTNDILKDILGKDFSTRVIRFPGGYWSWDGREPMRDKMIEYGYCNIDWNALNGDAEGKKKNADQLFNVTKDTVERLGSEADSIVILMHDTYGKEETVKALPKVIEYLKANGYEFRTIK